MVYWVAGIWGVLIITPLYFMIHVIAEKDPPAITHPAFYYGFVGTALAWQIAFIVIARDPLRFRPMMIPSMVEKFLYGPMIAVLVMQGRTNPRDLVFAATDTVLGLLFVAAYRATRDIRYERSHVGNL
jgi:hypothetical protein